MAVVTSSREHDDHPNGHTEHAEGPRCDVPQNPWAPLVENLRELVDYLSYYLSVQADQVRLRIRRFVLGMLLCGMAVISGLSVIITAVVILLAGAGQGFGQLFGGRLWLGNLVTGIGVLCLTVLMLVVISRRIVRISRTKTVEKYAELRQHQRRQHGHDVGSRSHSSAN
jgi:hypothetical protein